MHQSKILTDNPSQCAYLVLIEVCDDHAHKQSESNHTAQEHKDVYVDTVDLRRKEERRKKENTK